MALTERAARMLRSLPDYYWEDPLVARMLQAVANEIDRLEQRALAVRAGLMPAASTDLLGLLSLWEQEFGLPVAPAASEDQRRAKIVAALRKLDVASGVSTMAALRAAAGGLAIEVLENVPGPLQDTLVIPFDESSYSAGQVQELAERIWPAHRKVYMRYGEGFKLDRSRLDADTL